MPFAEVWILLANPSPRLKRGRERESKQKKKKHHGCHTSGATLPANSSNSISDRLLSTTSRRLLLQPPQHISPAKLAPPLCTASPTACASLLKSDLPSSSSHPAFWVCRVACSLIDVLPDPVPGAGQRPKEDEFDSLPHWFEDVAKSGSSLLPWLPLSPSQIPMAARKAHYECKQLIARKEETGPFRESVLSGAPLPFLHPQAHEKASTLKTELLGSDSTMDSLHLATEIRQICLESGAGNELMMLELINHGRQMMRHCLFCS